MRYYFSNLINEIKQERSFAKWIEERKAEIKNNAYENRREIDKWSIADDQKNVASLIRIWKPFKALMKKNDNYDIIIKIDNKGYLSFDLIFPVTQKQIDKAMKLRAESRKNGYWFVDFDECLYMVCNENVKEKLGGMFELCEQPYSYPSYCGNPMQRITSFWKAK